MSIPIYHVDTFTGDLFRGNSAAVCPLSAWLPADLMQRIAAENGVAETAFLVGSGADWQIRWFTPEIEMDLCGHATLASAHVLAEHFGVDAEAMRFSSPGGLLTVTVENGGYTLALPARPAVPAVAPDAILEGIGRKPKEILKARDFLLVFESEDAIRSMRPNRAVIDTINLDPGGIIVTAPGVSVDFVCRYFTPQASIFEDPVTGSAFCSLIPYWAARLGVTRMTSSQLSARGGEIGCRLLGDTVAITGQAVTYSQGLVLLPTE